MAFNVEVQESFVLVPIGQYTAVCCELLDLGYKNHVYKNKDTGADEPVTTHEIQYVFQLNKLDPETGKRYEMRSAPLNLKLSEKANLRKFLLQWRGHDITEAEQKPPGVDVDLAGRGAIISVVHNKSGEKTFANIGAIMPLMEGMAPIEPIDYKSKQGTINQANAAAASGQSSPNMTAPVLGQPPQMATVSDDIPF